MAKWYVYTLSYPPALEGGAVFYVGKGQGPRMHTHEVSAAGDGTGPRSKTIQAIWDAGYQIVKAKVLETDDEQAAFEEETRLIRLYQLSPLTNQRKVVILAEEPRPSRKPTQEQSEWYEKCRIYAETTTRLLVILTTEYGMNSQEIADGVWHSGYKPHAAHIDRYLNGQSTGTWKQAQALAAFYTRVSGNAVDLPLPY